MRLAPFASRLLSGRTRFAAALVAALFACASAAHAAPAAKPVRATQPAVTLRHFDAPAPSAASAPATAPARVQSSAWTKLGPTFFSDKVNCVTSHMLSVPVIDVGSDGNGFYEGSALADYGWTERGGPLGHGVQQMKLQLVFPDTGGYFERRTILGTDGVLRYSDDDGATSAPCALSFVSGEVQAPLSDGASSLAAR